MSCSNFNGQTTDKKRAEEHSGSVRIFRHPVQGKGCCCCCRCRCRCGCRCSCSCRCSCRCSWHYLHTAKCKWIHLNTIGCICTTNALLASETGIIYVFGSGFLGLSLMLGFLLLLICISRTGFDRFSAPACRVLFLECPARIAACVAFRSMRYSS